MSKPDGGLELRMTAYYYEFRATGVAAIDKILSAVACAGKAYHHTTDWYNDSEPYPGHTGDCPVGWIQDAADEAAKAMIAHEAGESEKT